MGTSNNNDVYWAAETVDKVGAQIFDKIDNYYKYCTQTGRMAAWRRNYEFYHAAVFSGGRLGKSGEVGQYTSVSVNHFRNLLQHLLTITVNQRPAFEPRATNSDVKSQAQTILARGLLDYYMREKRLERDLMSATEFALLFGEGYVHTQWDATKGESFGVDPDTGIEQKEGDIRYSSHEPVNVIRDPMLNDYRDRPWIVIRSFENKFDLAAKYPEYADRIKGISWKFDSKQHYMQYMTDSNDSDMIPTYTFYHARTDALPEGRAVTLLEEDLVLLDGALPYRHMPIYRVCPSDIIGTPFGYTIGYDLAPLQEALDGLYSTIITNQETFGVQNIMAPKGNNLSVTQLAGGLNFIEYNDGGGKPEALNLTSTPPEVFKFVQMLEQMMETISGVNSVSRGDPSANLKSGAAMALVQSMAIQFSQQLQWSYVQLLEDVGTSTITMLRDYASVPRIAMISGKNNRGMMKEFTGDDLDKINRVQVDAGNPMSRTTAGKVEMAQMMLQAGMIKMPDELLQVIQTGNLEPLTSGTTSELLSLKTENEKLADGEQVPVMITDDHLLHINEHKTVVADPEARMDPKVVQAVTEHIMQHMSMLSDPANAQLLTLMGQQPVPPQQPQGVPAAAGQPTPGTAIGQPPANPQQMVADHQPNMPKNAMSGHPFDPTSGGLQ